MLICCSAKSDQLVFAYSYARICLSKAIIQSMFLVLRGISENPIFSLMNTIFFQMQQRYILYDTLILLDFGMNNWYLNTFAKVNQK